MSISVSVSKRVLILGGYVRQQYKGHHARGIASWKQFDKNTKLWKSGQITAKLAMTHLGFPKPRFIAVISGIRRRMIRVKSIFKFEGDIPKLFVFSS